MLGYKITEENRQKAKEHLENCGLVAIHLRDQDPLRPTAVGVDVFQRDPFTFITYPASPIIKPTKSLSESIEHGVVPETEVDEEESSSEGQAAPENFDTNESIIPFCKSRLLDIMKLLGTEVDPSDEQYYEERFLTAEMQFTMMEEIFPNLKKHCTVERLQYWVGKAKVWGERKRKTIGGKSQYVRRVWVVKKDFRKFLNASSDSVSSYWHRLQNESNFITIGYVRKSQTSEVDSTRVRLLQMMIEKLYFKMKCEEVYASPYCSASEPILERDSPPSEEIMSALRGCNGFIADLTRRLHHTQKKIRLAIIDYAGLSTSPVEISNFLKSFPNIKEIAVDHGRSIEILTRHQLLKEGKAEKFDCRTGPIRRSS